MEEEVKNKIESYSHIKLVIYCRVSTMNQFLKKEKGKGYISQKSLDEQLEYCLSWARKKDLIFKNYFKDYTGEIESGGHLFCEDFPEKERFELIDTLKDLERLKDNYKEIYLLCFSVSRLSRNLEDARTILHFCKKNKISLAFSKEDFIVNDKASEEKFFKEVIRSQKFLEELPYHIKQGQEKVISEGKHVYGIPFGTVVDEGYLKKNEYEYQIKLTAQRMRNLRYSYPQIVSHFNEQQYHSRTRRAWTIGMIRGIVEKRELDPEVKAQFKLYKNSFKSKDSNKITSSLFELIKALANTHDIKLSVLSEESTISVESFNPEIKELFKSYEKEVKNNRSNNSKKKKKALEVIELGYGTENYVKAF